MTPQIYLFVPGNRPDRFAKAFAAAADRVILDLEDAVAPADKAAARAAIAQWLAGNDRTRGQTVLRINDSATQWYSDDVALAASSKMPCVMLPKCEASIQVATLAAELPEGTHILPLIESARGLLALNDIASTVGVTRLAFGSIDYMADLDIPPDSPALIHAAIQMAVASRAAGLPSPVAGVTPGLEGLQVSVEAAQARRLGFGAKMCIHPAQIAAVRAALAPTAEEMAWAERVLQAWGPETSGAIQVDGKMIDRPVVLKAQRIAAQAKLSGQTPH